MKKVLVTGSEGFIGKSLKNLLIENHFDVDHFDDSYLDSDSWVEELNRLLDKIKPEVIFHVGACSDTLETNVEYMMTRNYESTKIITDWSVKNGKKLIYSSSAANYGVNGNYPSNLYGWSKYVAEGYVISNGGIALRYFNVYGPGEDKKGRMASVAYQMFLKEKNGEKIKLFPKKPKRDFVYIKDVIDANFYAMNNYEKLKYHFYEVGSGIAEEFESVLNNMNISFDYHPESQIPEGYQFFTCSDKNKWMEGWLPKWNLKDGINDYKKYITK
jgi:ADP-L-glycero-D-manno-heptose 6-epimerase